MRVSVTMTSDFVCPWCFIGETKLFQAIERLPGDIEAAVSYRPFELNPGMPAGGVTRRAYREAKFGSWARSQAMDAQVAAAGAAVGLRFNYDRVERTPNTTVAHRLMWALAADGGDQKAFATAMFTAYFTDGLDLSDPAVLRRVATGAGLAPARADAVLDGTLGAAEVAALTRDARTRGVDGVPLFEMGGFAMSGAQPAEVLEAALLRAARRQAAA